jgi:putative transposase
VADRIIFQGYKTEPEDKRFYGNSRNAVMTQVWIALIAYLIFYLLKMKSKREYLSFTNFISVIKMMLFQRVSLLGMANESRPASS